MPDDDTVEIPVGSENSTEEGSDSMATEAPNLYEQGNLAVAMTGLGNEFGAAAARRVNSADQLSGDSQRMWSIAMTSPTVMAAHGMRMASEMGSGRTRSETNLPAHTSAPQT